MSGTKIVCFAKYYLSLLISGEPIQCINDGGVPTHVINTYCWITYTFTLPHEQGKPVGTHVAHPGLGNENQERRYHSYYQWVPFVLFFQVNEVNRVVNEVN